METRDIKAVYFSATYTTRKVVRAVAGQFGKETEEFDITSSSTTDCVRQAESSHKAGAIHLDKESLLIAGMPVYAGRIPASAASALNRFRGDGTPAVIICVYGNRDYDDALLELRDILENNGFKVVSAGVFIAQHSIFPELGAGRPDSEDMKKIEEFGRKSAELVGSLPGTSGLAQVKVKGNNPYKQVKPIPLFPKGNFRCDNCGACSRLCPSGAIDLAHPKKTDKEKCISCGRCIAVCHTGSRRFRGIPYSLVRRKFIKLFSRRLEPETYFVS